MAFGGVHPFMLKKAAGGDDPVADVTKSLRFNGSDSPSLSRTYTSNATWTFSVWVKRAELGATNNLLGTVVQFNSSDQLVTPSLTTTAVYRDVSAWYHICVSDSGLYVNGVQVTGTVSTSALSDAKVGDSFDGFLSDVRLIDGTALDATSFAEEDSNGQWVPKGYSGSYGTEGFHLDFKDDTDIGDDESGNGNDFTASNLSAWDVVRGNPSAGDNYAVLNVLASTASGTAAGVASEANLQLTWSGGTSSYFVPSTIGFSSGKFYYEAYINNNYGVGADVGVGVTNESANPNAGLGNDTNSLMYESDGDKYYNASSSSYSSNTWGDDDVLGVAVDADTGKVWYSVNGTWEGSPTGGTGEAVTLSGNTFFAAVRAYAYELTVNFGQDPFFAGGKTSGQDSSQSEFFYAPPTGFVALKSSEIATPTIAKPAEYFDTLTYASSGAKTFDNGSTTMQPDLVWVKARGNTYDHELTDSVRGVTKALSSNATNVESTDSTGLTAFGSDGFTVGAGTNYSTSAMVAWCFKKSATAGFNIVGWTGDDDGFTGGTQAVAHGLGVAPEMVIAKDRTNGAGGNGNWIVYHKDITSGDLLKLNSDGGEFTPYSTLIGSVGSTNVSFGNDSAGQDYLNSDNSYGSGVADTYIGYFMASVTGYSKVGSFSGSSSAFIYTGFRPTWILAKRYDSTGGNWMIFDDKREGYNVDNDDLMANSSAIEATTDHIDILSNGFRIRTSDSDLDSGTVIYYAVGQNSKYANAR